MAYDSPGTLGPTASYVGDPADYSGSNFDVNNFIDTLGTSLGPILGGIGNIINASNGQPGTTYINGVPQPQGTPPPQPQKNNTALYIGMAVGALVLIILLIFLLKK